MGLSSLETEQSALDLIAAGHEALRSGSWEEARARFERAVATKDSPEALEGLGLAAWWLGDGAAMFDARERAFRLYRERGDARGAARVATSLAVDYNDSRGEFAVAKGWLQRARRLLDGLDDAPERGWVAIWEGLWSLPDTASARRLGAEAAGLGRSLALMDLEMAGLALEGLALVSEGQVAEGMARLDEASAAAVAGEVQDLAVIGEIHCFLIYACELVRDYDRAAQWCNTVRAFCERWSIRPLFGLCRTHYSSVLMWRGAWAEAERELAVAQQDLAETRPAMAVEAIVRLAEIRRRQGRFQEAAQLFAQVEFHPLGQIGRAQLALDQAEPASALDLVERFLRGIPREDRTERAAGLEVLVRGLVDLGRVEQAGPSLAELQEIVGAIGTEALRATAHYTEGLVQGAGGEWETARQRFEDAVDLFARSGAPFEAACARLKLAEALRALNQGALASVEASASRAALLELGASFEASRAERMLHELAESDVDGAPSPGPLTRRELDVLRLVARGLSNQAIAGQLVLSEHTVHRHMSSILDKLDLPSRAAAAAYAVQRGLV